MSISDPLPTPQNESETSDYVERIDATDRSRLVGQGVLHYSGQIASVLSSLALVPLMLTRLGAEAYGFWIVALAVPGFVTGLDNALYLSITRETASHRRGDRISDDSISRFLSACCGACVLVGLLSGVFVVCSGALVTRNLHLSAAVRADAVIVLVSVAVAYAAGRAVVFGNAVLSGFQRFVRSMRFRQASSLCDFYPLLSCSR
jgi:O-antigen/teichoic acid export membrane protein